MKNFAFLFMCLFTAAFVFGQAPAEINYQGVARNIKGSLLSNQEISLRLSIHDAGVNGPVVYQETRTLRTNGFGLFTVGIGSTGATTSSGTLGSVNWGGGGGKYLQVEMDPEGRNGFIQMGTSQLLSVPYAFYAGKALPSGTAGGALAGSYPNPGIAANAISTTAIQDGAITASKLAPGVLINNLQGPAGGDLSGAYPNPQIAGGAITSNKIADGAITSTKLAAGTIPSSLPPNGTASGDLNGNYPNPTINTGAVTSAKLADNAVITIKIADGSVTAAKLAPGVIPTSIPVSGSAGGVLTGSYPNPALGTGVVGTVHVADGSITAAKLAPGVIPTSIPVSGSAGGVLTGSYPNPALGTGVVGTVQVADGSITAAKLASGVLPTSLPPSGAATGDLTGNYPSPVVNAGAITSSKIADAAITTVKIADGSVTAAKLAPGVIPTSIPVSGSAGGDLSGVYPNPAVKKIQGVAVSTAAPSTGQVLQFDGVQWSPVLMSAGGSTPTGPAGGDLNGAYPNPNISPNSITSNKLVNDAVTTQKINDGAVTNVKLADGSITAAKLAPGVIPTSIPVSGTAGGDLTGTYPNPAVMKIQGIGISGTAPSTGQVLQYNGTQWTPATFSAGGFTLPYSSTNANSGALFSLTNSNTGSALLGINSSANANAIAVEGKISSLAPGTGATAVKGTMLGTGADGSGVWGSHAGSGEGVLGTSSSGFGVSGKSQSAAGVFGTSSTNNAGFFDISNTASYSDAVFASTVGTGSGITGISDKYIGVQGITNNAAGIGIQGFNNAGGEAIHGITFSAVAPAVVGQNFGPNAGIAGISAAGGTGVLAQTDAGGSAPGSAVVGELIGSGAGNTALFKANNSNVARIDNTGKGFFNGGTQTGGADVAEYFDVEGSRKNYEPGDVLSISTSSDRAVEKSTGSYSSLVAGVFATKPGVLLTEHNAEQDMLQAGVPMGVIGVIPTKVCAEAGMIKRGDMLVTSSQPGVAMKADPEKVKPGQVIGKALQDYNGNGVAKIIVLVCIR